MKVFLLLVFTREGVFINNKKSGKWTILNKRLRKTSKITWE